MSFGSDIAGGIATQIGGLLIIVFVAGMAAAGGLYGLYLAGAWLLHHVVLV